MKWSHFPFCVKFDFNLHHVRFSQHEQEFPFYTQVIVHLPFDVVCCEPQLGFHFRRLNIGSFDQRSILKKCSSLNLSFLFVLKYKLAIYSVAATFSRYFFVQIFLKNLLLLTVLKAKSTNSKVWFINWKCKSRILVTDFFLKRSLWGTNWTPQNLVLWNSLPFFCYCLTKSSSFFFKLYALGMKCLRQASLRYSGQILQMSFCCWRALVLMICWRLTLWTHRAR